MSIKTYGIYLAYPPTIDLRSEGLGRQLAAFINGASQQKDVQFVIVCPSWSRDSILELCQSECVPDNSFDLISPKGYFISLKCYTKYQVYTKNIKNYLSYLAKKRQKSESLFTWMPLKIKIVTARNVFDLLFFIPGVMVLGFLILISKLFIVLKHLSIHWFKYICGIGNKISGKLFGRIKHVLLNPKDDKEIFKLYQQIEKKEIALMLDMINTMDHVTAWFAPTAFWPSFNKIKAPKFICVPDVVLTEFPVGFSDMGGDRILNTFKNVEKSIYEGDFFVTYSEHIKQTILVERYGVNPKNVHVVHHAPNDLAPFITLNDLDENASRQYCEELFLSAMNKASNPDYTTGFANTSVQFIFYASQFRPSKNVLTLLRAYHYLLRKRFISHKLILTGKPGSMVETEHFISAHGLSRDVLLLPRLTVSELAACYKLADLAVNPSLSEGGCPFTFSEALSVGTPVIMANIPVTVEIIQDPELQRIMLFDPYDWKDLAKQIEWALGHKKQLFDLQMKTYKQLSQRTWTHVSEEYIAILDHLALPDKKLSTDVNIQDEGVCLA